MKAHDIEKWRFITYVATLTVVCAVPVLAQDRSRPPTPSTIKTAPIVTNVKPLTDRPPTRPPQMTGPDYIFSSSIVSTGTPTHLQRSDDRAENRNERKKVYLKRQLPPAGSRIITHKPPERKREVHKGTLKIQPSAPQPNAVKTKGLTSKSTSTTKRAKQKNRAIGN
jgi:hypothetical protein